MKILSIDPGTQKIGMTLFDNDSVVWTREIELGKNDLNVRYSIARMVAEEILDSVDGKIDHFAIETPFFGRNVSTAIKLGTLRGILIGCIFRKNANADILDISPIDTRRVLGLKANADKTEVHRLVTMVYGKSVSGAKEDALDSVAIGMAAMVKVKQEKINGKKQIK